MRTGKVLSILLALVLCLSLAAPVLAAEEETAGALTNKQLLELLPSQPVPAVAPQQLEQAAHREELPRPVRTVVTVCGAVRGVGGIDSWGSDVEPAYQVRGDQDIGFSFWIHL